MPRTTSTRVDEDLFASAQIVAPLMERSAAQQVVYWARLGREIEAGAGVSHRDVADALAGRRRYDDLSAEEQAIVRTEWAQRMAARREQLNLADTFAADGRSYVELDNDGKVIRRDFAS